MCGNDYKRESDLSNHQTVHEQVVFTCDLCPKKIQINITITKGFTEMGIRCVPNVGPNLKLSVIFQIMLKCILRLHMSMTKRVAYYIHSHTPGTKSIETMLI